LHGITEHLIGFVTHIIAMFGYLGVFMWMTLESACIPIPSEAIMAFAGTHVGHGFNINMLAFVGAFGNLFGSIIAYAVGHYGGRPFISKYGKYVLINHHDVDLADRWFDKHGDATVFWARMLPIVRTFISLPAGISRMNFPKFCIYTFVGALPFCYALAYAGVKLGEHWIEVSKLLHKADAVVLAVLIVMFALWLKRHLDHSQPAETVETEAPRTEVNV
jgi:membrane protein DedA with SNARE-associated domain